VLNQGQSASHTFTTPGTFAYTCQIHPFMHGTVVVLASSAPSPGPPAGATTPSGGGHGTAGTAGTTASPPASPDATPATGQPTLPVTGANLISVVLAGVLLCVGGVSLRLALFR
jgi:hypothetical protein